MITARYKNFWHLAASNSGYNIINKYNRNHNDKIRSIDNIKKDIIVIRYFDKKNAYQRDFDSFFSEAKKRYDMTDIVMTNDSSQYKGRGTSETIKIKFSEFEKYFNTSNIKGDILVALRRGKVYAFQSSRHDIYAIDNKLKYLVNGDIFSANKIYDSNHDVFKSNRFVELKDIILNSNKKAILISIFNNICDSCSGGKVFKDLNRLYTENGNKVEFVTFMTNEFNQRDIENLKKIYGVRMAIVNANVHLAETMKILEKTYGKATVNEIALLVNRNGKVLADYHSGCNCMNEIIEQIRKL